MIGALGVRQRCCGVISVLLVITMVVLGQRFWSQRALGLPAGPDLGDAVTTRLWIAAGSVPAAEGVNADMITDALRDLHALDRDHGVTVAGWTPAWRYVWPRDSAFVASAYARTGHLAEAEAQIAFLQRVQATDGRFQARYLPDGSGPPDGRGVELDGSGWALWALAQVAAATPLDERAALIERHRALLDRSVAAITASLDPDTGLPPASLDYWEVADRRPTLATGAVLLAGLRSAEGLYAEVDDTARRRATITADQLQDAVIDRYEPRGYPRHPDGPASSVDLGATFLLAPFAGVDRPALTRAWRGSVRHLSRPAGGLAPGGSWRNDGISWTPTTATYAVAAACADPVAARWWLAWLDGHRTAGGSLPEKVLSDGSPASVAPLAWTAAAVIIATDQLQRGCRD